MNAHLWQELGNAYIKLGAFDQAISAYSKVLPPYDTDREKALGWRVVADLYLELNEPALAAEAFMQSARLFVTQPVDESPRTIVADEAAESSPPPPSAADDQAAPEIEAPVAEVLAAPPEATANSGVTEQQAEQAEALSFEQLPLGIPGYEQIEPAKEAVKPEAAEAAVEAHPDQLEMSLEVVETESAPEIEAVASVESVDLEPNALVVEQARQVEVEAILESAPEATKETVVEVEATGESATETESSEMAVVQEVAVTPVIAEESAPEVIETQTDAEVERQATLAEESPAEASAVNEEVVPILEVVPAEQLVAAGAAVASEENQQPVLDVIAEDKTAVEESAPAAKISEPEVVASAVSEKIEVQETVLEAQAIENASSEEAEPALEPTTDEKSNAEEAGPDVIELVASESIQVAIDDIVPNPYVVLHTAGMDELVETIRQEGMVHPLIVTPNVWNNKYLLLVGEWRLEAARRAGLQVVPVLIRDVNPKEFLEVTLLQNARQAYLNPLELAQLYQFLIKDFNLSLEAIAERVGRSPLAVENILRLQSLTVNGRQALIEGKITEDHAQALLYLHTPELQDEVLQAIVENEMSIERTEEYIAELNARDPEVQQADQKPAIEIIVENEVAPQIDVTSPENTQPDQLADTVEGVETQSSITDDAHAPLIVYEVGESKDDDVSSDLEPPHSDAMPLENEGAYPVALPGTLADVRKNVLMAWKLENDPMPAAYVAPAKMEVAGESSGVAVINQVEQAVIGRTIFLPDTNTVLQNLNDQALAEAVVEVVVPVMEVVEEVPEAAQETKSEESMIGTESIAEVASPSAPADEASLGETAPAATEALPRTREEDAVLVYKRVTELNPTNDRAWHMLGNLLLDLGRLDEAISALEVAISLNATRDIYYYHLGIAQAVQKNYGDAVQSFEKALVLNPKNIFAHCSIIGYYRKLGREADAEQHFQIVAPNIKLEKAYNRACFESICGNIDSALELLRQAIEIDHVPVKWIERDPDLDLLRDDPRYKTLIASVA